jgi:hypothetical protein
MNYLLCHNHLPSKLHARWSHLHQLLKSTKPDLLLYKYEIRRKIKLYKTCEIKLW